MICWVDCFFVCTFGLRLSSFTGLKEGKKTSLCTCESSHALSPSLDLRWFGRLIDGDIPTMMNARPMNVSEVISHAFVGAYRSLEN